MLVAKKPGAKTSVSAKGLIRNALWISEYDEWPVMMFLIRRQPCRLCERDNDDRHPSPIELIFECFHLTEVMLAGQSGKVPEKN